MADTLDLTGIHTDLMNYAQDNKDHIFTDMSTPGENEGDAENSIYPMNTYTDEMDTPDEVVFTHIYVNGALKPGGKRDVNGKIFRPKNDAVKFKTRKGKVREVQMDFLFTREKIIRLKKSYYAQCQRMIIKPDVLPFEAFIINELIKEAQSELRIGYFKGVYNDAGQTFLDCFDGIIKQVQDAILDDGIPADNVTEQAAITASNAITSFEAIVDGIPTEMLGKLVCVTSRKVKEYYERNIRAAHGGNTDYTGLKKSMILGTSIPFIVEPGLDDFHKPILLPKNNIVRLYDNTSDKLNLAIDYDKRERDIAFVYDGQAGVGFGVGEHIWTMVTV